MDIPFEIRASDKRHAGAIKLQVLCILKDVLDILQHDEEFAINVLGLHLLHGCAQSNLLHMPWGHERGRRMRGREWGC